MENIQQKRQRLEDTINRCTSQINNPGKFSSPAIVEQFKKALEEAKKQLKELNNEQSTQQPAQTLKVEHRPNVQAQEPVTSQPKTAPAVPYTPAPVQMDTAAPNVPTTPNVPTQEALKPEPTMQDTIGDASVGKPKIHTPVMGIIGGQMPPLYRPPFCIPQPKTETGVMVIETEDSSPTDTIATTIHTCNSAGRLFVKIVWVGGIEELLLEGQCKSKFTSRLADCAESRSAMDKNWGKLKISNSFRKLVAYYKALSHYPRPSDHKWPTVDDIGAKYFLSENRKKLWLMIQEEIITEENAAKQ